nr:hypothetical protein B12F1.120 [imported] - Neurospora crassa [Neurospora crassa]
MAQCGGWWCGSGSGFMPVSPGSYICSTPSPAPFLSFQKPFLSLLVPSIPFGPGRDRLGLPFRWMRRDALSSPHQKDPSFHVKLRLKLALAGFTSEAQDSVGLPAPERQGDKARGRQLGRVACCASLVRPGEVMPVPTCRTCQAMGGRLGTGAGTWGTQKGKEARITKKKQKKQKEGTRKVEAQSKLKLSKTGAGLSPILVLICRGTRCPNMPTDSTPGPISHTEGTAMPCHAMLCDSMPANRSDRQQYDWSVPPGGKMTSEEAQNWQSEILCFFEPDPFQKFSKVPVSQSRFPGRLFRTSRLLGRPRGRWSCALARLATLLQVPND